MCLNSFKKHLEAKSFKLKNKIYEGELYTKDNIAIILDTNLKVNSAPIHSDLLYPYHQYTYLQNTLMSEYDLLFRFLAETKDDYEHFKIELENLLNNFEFEAIKHYGADRSISSIDPTKPEYLFENIIEKLYGFDTLSSLERESPISDIYGQGRHIDYVIPIKNQLIAIELNGVNYHHPQIIGSKKYRSQLTKQNSIIAQQGKLFRWSLETILFEDKFNEQINLFLKTYLTQILPKSIPISRQIQLYEHQKNTLQNLQESRKQGKNSFLIVFPTGTGKTKIIENDFIYYCNQFPKSRLLFLVPSRSVRDQVFEIFKKLISNNEDSLNQISINQINVFTYANITKKFRNYENEYFDYIVIDEAHHAVAPALQKAITYFNPNSLIGLTATPDRLDGRKIEKIFGESKSQLTLEEAIERDVLVRIKAFRIKTNIDLSEVRYNGKDYVVKDLQNTLIIPSRDQIVIDALIKHFVNKNHKFISGIIFCVNIKHAERIALMLRQNGIKAAAVSSKEKKSNYYIEEYQKGNIQFLTTCSLLTEGWDSPRTSIIVMARPTMSKVLYMQQIGRGTRKYPDKDSLYILDVVDNYGNFNTPWSIHSIFGISNYLPMYDVLKSRNLTEETIIGSEKIIKIEKINIHTFQSKYPDHISVEELARELFVSTGTIKNWIKSKKIQVDLTIPFGSKKLYYFKKSNIDIIRKELGLSIHDDNTILDDFWEFIGKRDYTFSYKMIFMLSYMKNIDNHGEVDLTDLVKDYTWFYEYLSDNQFIVDRPNSKYTKQQNTILNDKNKMTKSLLDNPFEKFERKRFIYYSKDLKRLSFSPILFEKLKKIDFKKIIQNQMISDLTTYYEKLSNDKFPIAEIKNHFELN